jgi:hypothetical protein
MAVNMSGTLSQKIMRQLVTWVSAPPSSGPMLKPSIRNRHQFRFIVSAEDGTELGDLKSFVRDLMRQLEHDLATGLDWSRRIISTRDIRTPMSSYAADGW